jgi:hypothetical protein
MHDCQNTRDRKKQADRDGCLEWSSNLAIHDIDGLCIGEAVGGN